MKRRNPSTSIDAWHSVRDTPMLSDHQLKILAALDDLKTGISETIAIHTEMDKAQIYRRMNELEKLNLIRKTGNQRKTSSGRNSYEYEISLPPTPKTKEVSATYTQNSLFS